MRRFEVMQVLLHERILGRGRSPARDCEGDRATLWCGSRGIGATGGTEVAVPAGETLLGNTSRATARASTTSTAGSYKQCKHDEQRYDEPSHNEPPDSGSSTSHHTTW